MLSNLFNHIPAFVTGCFCGAFVGILGVLMLLHYLVKSAYNEIQNMEDAE